LGVDTTETKDDDDPLASLDDDKKEEKKILNPDFENMIKLGQNKRKVDAKKLLFSNRKDSSRRETVSFRCQSKRQRSLFYV
jgi:hypothetical protein